MNNAHDPVFVLTRVVNRVYPARCPLGDQGLRLLRLGILPSKKSPYARESFGACGRISQIRNGNTACAAPRKSGILLT